MWKEHKNFTTKNKKKELGARKSYINRTWKTLQVERIMKSYTIKSRKMKLQEQ
jgi:hypothetical protein